MPEPFQPLTPKPSPVSETRGEEVPETQLPAPVAPPETGALASSKEHPQETPLENEVPPELANARVRGRRPLPASPLERAQLESRGLIPTQNAAEDRSTMVAFGLLFVVPILIILLSLVLLLPFINAQLTQEQDPGGAITQQSPNGQTPTR